MSVIIKSIFNQPVVKRLFNYSTVEVLHARDLPAFQVNLGKMGRQRQSQPNQPTLKHSELNGSIFLSAEKMYLEFRDYIRLLFSS